jgi:glycosyltransferase involved in cell wall biosynthesis
MKNYDFSFILSDGSIPFLFSKKNYLHVQVPFNFSNQVNFVNKIKLSLINSLICNSQYTQKWIQKTYHTLRTQVLYPPVKITKHKNKSKNKFQILSVSRFNNNLNSKRQDILIKAFKLLHKKDNKYSLTLAGSSPVANSQIDLLKKQAKGLPIKFVLNPNSRELNKLYSDSGLFWHAAGYGVDENIQPEKTEHFGMVLVEAISYGCQVFAVDKGGAREIIDNGTNGYLYTKLHDLVKKTLAIANKPVNLDLTIQKFSVTNFEIALMNLFS